VTPLLRVALLLATAGLAACGGSGGDPPLAATQAAAPERPAAAGESGARPGPAATGLRLRRVGTFASPTYVTAPPEDGQRLFVVEQEGTIRVVRRGRALRRPFLDIRGRVQAGGERGLLSMAFAPDYERSRRFYVYYTGNSGDIRVVEFRGRGDLARKKSARSVLRQDHSTYSNHNGGQLQFGPDGLLYIGTGDGGGGGDPFEAGQSLRTHLGKLLRIDPRGRPYRVPRSNPFRDRAGARPAIYAYGLRNPWRFSFDRATGDLAIADVGQDAVEEVDFVRAGRGSGANFGWDAFEGTRRHEGGSAPGHVPPVIEHLQSAGFCSITGGYVLRHSSYGDLRGLYVYSDFCDGTLRGARLAPGGATGRRTFGSVSSPSSFGEDGRGRVYVASLSGPVYRLAPR
jgi:glucose/arabinose dehydrogenase